MGSIYDYRPAPKKPDRVKDLDELRVYTLTELEPVLGVTHRTLMNYVKNGRLKATKVGGKWKVSHENIRRFVNGY